MKSVIKMSLVLVLGLAIVNVYSRNLDGTGPKGLGSDTGRGKGICQGVSIDNQGRGLGLSRRGQGRGMGNGLGLNRDLSSQDRLKQLKVSKVRLKNEIAELEKNIK